MKNILMLIVLAFLITGCSTKPIVNLQHEPLTTVEMEKSPTLQEVEKAIIQAGDKLDWQGKSIKPGLIESTYARKNYNATVEISYTEKDFNINYKDSNNLKYNDGKIHKNYNRWIANLSKSIKEQIHFNASLTGEEVTIKTVEGLSFWQVDGERKVNALRVLSSGVGINSVVLMPGKHSFGALVNRQQTRIGSVNYKAKHEYLIDFSIEGSTIYFWVKDITDNIIIAGEDRRAK